MSIIDSQRYQNPISVDLYLKNQQMARNLLALDNEYIYVLTDYKTKEIQAIDTPNVLDVHVE